MAEANAVRTVPSPSPLAIIDRTALAAGGYPLTLAGATATAALAPAYVLRTHLRSIPTTALEVALLLTLAVFIFESLRLRRWPTLRSPVTIPALLFLLAGAISVLDSPSSAAAVGLYRAYFIEPILLAVVLLTIVRTRQQAYLVLLGLLAGAIVLALLNSAVVLRAIQDHTFQSQPPPVAVYPVGNMVALFLVPLAGVAGAIAVHEREPRIRITLGIVAAVIAISAVLSFSRGGWVALVAIAAGLALSTRLRWILLVLLTATALAVSRIPLIADHLAPMLQLGPTQSYDARLPLWKQSLRMLEAHPLLGAGLAGFVDRMKPYYPTNVIYPHDLFLNFWSETGLLGLAAFLAIVVAVAVVGWLGWRGAPLEWRPLHLGVLLALVAVVVHGLVDVPYFKNDLSVQFWILVALTLAARKAAVETPVQKSRSPATVSEDATRRR